MNHLVRNALPHERPLPDQRPDPVAEIAKALESLPPVYLEPGTVVVLQ